MSHAIMGMTAFPLDYLSSQSWEEYSEPDSEFLGVLNTNGCKWFRASEKSRLVIQNAKRKKNYS